MTARARLRQCPAHHHGLLQALTDVTEKPRQVLATDSRAAKSRLMGGFWLALQVRSEQPSQCSRLPVHDHQLSVDFSLP